MKIYALSFVFILWLLFVVIIGKKYNQMKKYSVKPKVPYLALLFIGLLVIGVIMSSILIIW